MKSGRKLDNKGYRIYPHTEKTELACNGHAIWMYHQHIPP